MNPTLEIDGVPIPQSAIYEFDQEYGEIVQRSYRRTADNTAVVRETGSAKLTTVISGRGWAPPGLAMLDTGSTHVIRCAMVHAAHALTNTVLIPAARRSDSGHEPMGFAIVDDEYVSTPIIGIAADVATLTAVPGAAGYVVHLFPEFTAVILTNTARGASSASFTWRIVAEEA